LLVGIKKSADALEPLITELARFSQFELELEPRLGLRRTKAFAHVPAGLKYFSLGAPVKAFPGETQTRGHNKLMSLNALLFTMATKRVARTPQYALDTSPF
jgi:hypothetical protein